MNEKELTHIDLFSGIGGFTLAGEWAGFRTIAFCEKEEFCQKVLKKHWPEIPIIEEIRNFDGTKWRGATLLTGGFPCQPFSIAGQRRGKEDDRYLWPEMLRVISETRPRWVLAENVPGIFRMALDTVLSDLEGEGYATGTFIIPACSLNAPHRRNRVWIVANARESKRNWLPTIGRQKMAKIGNENQNAQNAIGTGTRNQDGEANDQERRISQDRRKGIRQKDGKISTSRFASTNNHASDSQCLGRQKGAGERIEYEKQIPEGQDTGDGHTERIIANSEKWKSGQSKAGNGRQGFERGDWQENWYEVATRFCRVDARVPDRVYRLKALGNTIVPQVAYEILKNIAWIENERVAD